MMKPRRTASVWREIETLVNVGSLGVMTDGQLLDRFRDKPDPGGEEAFRILVERHGPMVLALCRSLVSDAHEAEDAFQATFLVLVRKADSIRKREVIGPWLYGVAGRVARRACALSRRRRTRETAVVDIPGPDPVPPGSSSDEQVILDEIARLPKILRDPVVICCLGGQSYETAAHSLGVSPATLRGRLHRARGRLEARLRKRGILALAAARISEPGGITPAALSASLVESTVQFSSRWSSVSGLISGAAAVPESIAALAQGVVHAMLIQTVKFAAIAVLFCACVFGTVVVAQGQRKINTAAAGAGARSGAAPAALAPQAAQPGALSSGQAGLPNRDQKTKQLLAALEEPVSMAFANKTPLNDVLKYIKEATTTPTYTGIPIYVEPKGLQDAKVTINSPVELNQEGVPLRKSLYQALKPLGLSYVVKDGFLMIDSRASVTEMRLEEVERKLDRILDALERLEHAG
jgi:RNA polymerase sigma factor (sigma-70 family)